MTRDEVIDKLRTIFSQRFEIHQPDVDVNLSEVYEFDSIDAIELLREIEMMLGLQLTREEKKKAMDVRSIGQIADYVMDLTAVRAV